MALYTPMNGWDATVATLRQGGSQPFVDTSEIYGVSFDEAYNPERRKQLGTKSPGSLTGRYEATGTATSYFITGAMVQEIYGQGAADKEDLRSHANRDMREFNLLINFEDFPIRVVAGGSPIDLIGYVLVGCLLESDSFNLEADAYVEKPLNFTVKDIIEKYDDDVDADIDPFLA